MISSPRKSIPRRKVLHGRGAVVALLTWTRRVPSARGVAAAAGRAQTDRGD